MKKPSEITAAHHIKNKDQILLLQYINILIIDSFNKKIICPMVLKVKTQAAEGVEHAIMLYDPPFQNATTWDDGNIGTSHVCNLTKISPTQQRQYVVSMLKLMLKAEEIINAIHTRGRCLSIELLFTVEDEFIMGIDIDIFEKTTFTIFMTIKWKSYSCDGEIKGDKKDVVFSKCGDISYIMDIFAKLCMSSRFNGTLSLCYMNENNEDTDSYDFDASMCIKKLMSPESSHPPLARDIPQEIRPPRQVRSLSPFRRIGIRPIPEEIMHSIRARDHSTYWPARINSPRPSFDEHL